MARRSIVASILLLVLVPDVRTQFFDFFGFPLAQNYQTQRPGNVFTTKRPRIESIQTTNHRFEQTMKKITSVTFNVDESVENGNTRQNSREKVAKKKNQNNNQNKQNLFTLAPINFNFDSTTAKPVRKANKNTSSQRNSTRNSNKNKAQKISRLPMNYDLDDDVQDERWLDKPVVNNINDYPPYDVTTRPDINNQNNNQNHNYDKEYSYPHHNNQFTTRRPDYTTTTIKSYNEYTTKNPYSVPNYNTYTTTNPYYNRPGVKPAIIENRPPITNRPVTNRPATNRPHTTRTTTKATKRPVIVPARPTDPGAISFPEDDLSPQIIIGPDEDYMSDVEKRRYIEMAERMCDKYKALNTMQLQAIPLIPSPDPVQVNVSSCAPVNIPLVVGGKVVRIEEFPHMALLGWLKVEGAGYSWKCGGSLISDQYVLTAAHCSYQERDNTVVTGPPRAVQLGSSYLDDSGALVVRVSAIVRHPKYKSPRSYHDVALLKLKNVVTFSQVIKPACLGVPPPVNEPIIATGWGRTEFSDQSLELRSVSFKIWDMNKCAEVLGTSRKLPTGPDSDNQVCAGEMRGGKDTCQGDSGGPAQIQDGCIWRVVAVTSLGRSCGAPNTPGLYAKVPRAFIAAQIFGGYRTSTKQTTTERNNHDNNNQQGYNNNQQGYNNNQQNYNNNQNYNQQQSNQNNNQRRDYRNNESNYQTSTIMNYRFDGSNYNNAGRDETITRGHNHRNVNVNAALNPNNNQMYNQNDRNYNTDTYNQQNNGNNYNNNNNQRRDYRDNNNNQNDYSYNNNRNGDYSGVNQQNYNNRDIESDSSRIWFT